MKNPQKVWRIIQTLMKDYRKGNLLALIDLSEATTFYIYRTDNNSVLAHGLNGYDAAQNKANQLRKQLGLKWDQVRFKSEKKSAENPVRQNFGKGIIKQPGEHIYANPSNNLSRVRLQNKDWDEGFIGY